MGSHRPKRGVDGNRQVNMEDSIRGCASGLLGQARTRISCGSWEVFECLSCNVLFQTAHDLSRVVPPATAASHIGSGSFVT
jgi:hypothetical protein